MESKNKIPPLPFFMPMKSAFPTAFHNSLRSLLWWEEFQRAVILPDGQDMLTDGLC